MPRCWWAASSLPSSCSRGSVRSPASRCVSVFLRRVRSSPRTWLDLAPPAIARRIGRCTSSAARWTPGCRFRPQIRRASFLPSRQIGWKRLAGKVRLMPSSALPQAIREEVARLGSADIMVGIPSFKNAATIGYVVRAAQAGLVQYFPDLRPVLVNADAGSPDGTQRVVVETEPPDYVESILLVRPRNRLQRISLTYPEVDGVGGKGAALRTIFQIAHALKVQALVVVDSDLRIDRPRMDRAARRADPERRLRLRRAPLLALQVRRHDHQHRHLPDDAGTLRVAHPAADRRRLRRQRRPRRALPRAGRLGCRCLQVRHRHLDDDQGDHRRASRSARRASVPRSTIQRTRAPTSGRCSARWSAPCCG